MEQDEILTGLKLLVWPLLAGIGASVFWRFGIYRSSIPFSAPDGAGFTDAGIPIVAAIYLLITGIAFARVQSENAEILKCVRMKNRQKGREAFDLIKDLRIAPVVHLLLAVTAGAVQFLFMMVHYEEAKAGISMTFITAFLVILIRQIANNLDDPHHALWYFKQIPPEWFEEEPTSA